MKHKKGAGKHNPQILKWKVWNTATYNV